MNKAAIIYFSGTGNTKYVANIIRKSLEYNNTKCDLINIEKGDITSLEYDYIIIGGPVYVERYPEILLKYVEKNLSNYKGKCMLFSTQAMDGWTAVFDHAVKRLKHINITYYNFIQMPNNFYNFMFTKSTDEQEKMALENAHKKANKIIKEFLAGNQSESQMSGFRVALADITYKMTYPYFRKWLMRKLSIDRDKCISCGICEKNCPTNSLTISPKLKITNDCTFCQRCFNNCPKNAFLNKKSKIEQYKIKIS